MKNFLKSFAIFASVALFFGACTEDTTAEVSSSIAAPEVVSIKPGNERFALSWTTSLEKYDELSKVVITYGSYTETLTKESGLVAGENTLYVEAPAGTYDDVTITAESTTGLTSEPQSFGAVTVYDQSSYSSYAPAASALDLDIESGLVTITFNELNSAVADDCQSWVVNYYTLTDSTAPTGEALVRSDLVVSIYDAMPGSDLTSTITYCPDGSIGESVDQIKVTAAVSVSIPEAPEAPIAVSAVADYEGETSKLYVSWSIDPSDSNYSYATLSYTPEGGEKVTLETQYVGDQTDVEITDLDPGRAYTIEVQCVTSDDYTHALSITSTTITTYNSLSYSSYIPVVSATTDGTTITAVFDGVHDDLVSIEMFDGATSLGTFTDVVNGAISVALASDVTSFTYVMTFDYADGLSDVEVEVTTATTVYSIDLGYAINSEGVYQIYSSTGLSAFSTLVNGGTTTASALLMNDIDLSDVCAAGGDSWQVIGVSTGATAYDGQFDGGGYSIKNLYIDTTSSYQGLFGYIGEGAVIKNVVMDSPNILAATLSGAVAGRASASSIIDNCYVIGTGSIVGSGASIGGVVGTSNGLIRNCHVTSSDITIEGYFSSTGGASCGGIVGACTSGVILGCTNNGTVAAGGTDGRSAGGIVSYPVNATIIGCSNTGSVTSPGANSGGIIGRTHSTTSVQILIGCYNTGAIMASSQYAGIYACCNAIGSLYGCYNTGSTMYGLVGYVYDVTYSGNYYLSTMSDFADSSETAKSGATALDAESDFNDNISSMNVAISSGLASVYSAVSSSSYTLINPYLSATYGFTITECSYTAGAVTPVIQMTYSDDAN